MDKESSKLFSSRQKLALKLLADGLTDAEIAGKMGVSQTTAHNHIENARRALKTTTRQETVVLAQSIGLI